MTYGCFVDIIQQDGKPVRMDYPMERYREVTWMGIMEQMAEKYNVGKRSNVQTTEEK